MLEYYSYYAFTKKKTLFSISNKRLIPIPDVLKFLPEDIIKELLPKPNKLCAIGLNIETNKKEIIQRLDKILSYKFTFSKARNIEVTKQEIDNYDYFFIDVKNLDWKTHVFYVFDRPSCLHETCPWGTKITSEIRIANKFVGKYDFTKISEVWGMDVKFLISEKIKKLFGENSITGLDYEICGIEPSTTINKGDIVDKNQYFIAKVNKQLKSAMVSSKDFADLKRVTIRQNKEMFESIESKIPGQMENISKGISEEFDIDIAMKVSQFVPLDVHYTDDNTLAYSMYINYGVTAEGSSEKIILSATVAFLNAAGKVIFLYCYGPKAELEWTRSASKLWADSILANNPSPPVQSSGRHGIKWKKVVEKSVIGAVAGGLIALVAILLKNKKRSGQKTDFFDIIDIRRSKKH